MQKHGRDWNLEKLTALATAPSMERGFCIPDSTPESMARTARSRNRETRRSKPEPSAPYEFGTSVAQCTNTVSWRFAMANAANKGRTLSAPNNTPQKSDDRRAWCCAPLRQPQHPRRHTSPPPSQRGGRFALWRDRSFADDPRRQHP